MKKIALLLSILMVLSLFMLGCNYESADIQIISEHMQFFTVIRLTEEEVESLLTFLNEAQWEDGILVRENDYKISLSHVTLNYNSGADGSFQAILNDTEKNKHIVLTEEQRMFIDSLLIDTMEELVSKIEIGETTYYELCSIIGLEGYWSSSYSAENGTFAKTIEWNFGNDGILRIHLSEPEDLDGTEELRQYIVKYEVFP